VYEDTAFTRAVRRGTRTRSGRPGPRYWQQSAHYELHARLDPATHRLDGRARITYRNRSPDTLHRVALHLRHNLFRGRRARRAGVPSTGGVRLDRVAVNGTSLSPNDRPGYRVEGTVAWLSLPSPLPPGQSLSLAVEWRLRPPPAPADGRQGRDGTVYVLGYWYPQIAVYDDLDGWVAEPYTGQAEFYMGRADYDVSVTVPHSWVVGATGRLQNPSAVLSAPQRRRLDRARHSESVVTVRDAAPQATAVPSTAPDSTVTWRFSAQSVRDFAWGASPRYRWDATRAVVARDGPGAPPDTVLVQSFYRPSPEAAAWTKAARLTAQAVETLSRTLRPYPYPTMTALEGVLRSGGMEYPMLTAMRPWATPLRLAGDLTHEVAHNWIPMAVGVNEKRYVWMDEGLTQYLTAQAMRAVYGPGPRPRGRPNDSEAGQRRSYLRVARQGYEVPLMRHGDDIPATLYFDLPYDKAAQVLSALRGLLGRATFDRARAAFFDRWWGKHPSPYDFFNTVADVADRDLSWFWHTWFYTTATLDQALSAVEVGPDSTRISVSHEGRAPMPARVVVTRTDGSTERHTVPVQTWLRGVDDSTLVVPSAPAIQQVEIDPSAAFPDVDRSNQRWTRAP
jgi:aminopeptidase N